MAARHAAALAALLLALVAARVHAAPQVWPQPTELELGDCGAAPVPLAGARLNVTVGSGDAQAAAAYIQRALDLALPDWGCANATANASGPVINVRVADATCLDPACYTHATAENYSLAVDAGRSIAVAAATPVGANWALSTLASLADGACALACAPLRARDGPRFGHRGLLLDTARNWFSPADIRRRVLDPMWAAKLNVLHWHVYDSQSQPLELRFDPRLWLPYSPQQAYSQADAADLVAYAFARGIRVLPEFDMPGHTAIFGKADPSLVACLDSLPWDGKGFPDNLANQPPAGQLRPEQVGVARQLLGEMAELFPNYIISSGADEVNFNCWNNATVVPQDAPEYAAYAAKWGAVLARFQEQVAASLAAANRTMAVWDESFTAWNFSGTPALPPGSVLLNWQAPDSSAAMTDAGYDVVLMPYGRLYLDCGLGTPDSAPNWCAPLNGWRAVYGLDPLAGFSGGAGNASRLLGAEAAAWSEHIVPAVLDYVLWPRAAALAERLWSAERDTRDADAAEARLERFAAQLEARGLRPSPLKGWDGTNFKYEILPQWCDTAPPQLDSEGVDYCAAAKAYAGVELTFENLVDEGGGGGGGGSAEER